MKNFLFGSCTKPRFYRKHRHAEELEIREFLLAAAGALAGDDKSPADRAQALQAMAAAGCWPTGLAAFSSFVRPTESIRRRHTGYSSASS